MHIEASRTIVTSEMRGLTEDEAAVIELALTAPPGGYDASQAEIRTTKRLMALGRMEQGPIDRRDGTPTVRVSTVGREAYRIYLALKVGTI